jgi:hypothetical protein
MRKWMNLFEQEAPPTVLYHGTTIENLISIFMSRIIEHRPDIDEGHHGVSFTSDIRTAKGFAHSDSRDGDYLHSEILNMSHPRFNGAVFVAHSNALGRLEPYAEDSDSPNWTEDMSEHEWRTFGDVPLSAISKVYVDKREVEQYRDVLLAHQNHTPKPWPGVDQEYWPQHAKWATDFVREPKRLAAIEEILKSPMVVSYPLAERADFAEPQRERIIQHMLSHLSRNMYWDTAARTKTGDPMNADDIYDMARDWGYDIKDPDVTNSPEFQKRLHQWGEARYGEVEQKLAAIPLINGKFAISRLINVKGKWSPSDGLGIYWTFDYEGTDIDESPWGYQEDGRNIWMHALVDPKDVDWFSTYLANMDWMHGDREQELRLKKGVPVTLVRFEDSLTDKTMDVGKTFKA